MHEDELPVDAATVRDLVREQFPEWKEQAIVPVVGSGTVNAIFRIGSTLTARFPLRAQNPPTVQRWLEDEARALAECANASPFPAPRPIALGRPGRGYPLAWSVQTWLDGEVATPDGLADSESFAGDLAELVRAFRRVDTRGRVMTRGGRGAELTDLDEQMALWIRRSADLMDTAPVQRAWTRLRALPRGDDVMTHGDLTPGNLLVRQGRLSGVLDGGGFGPADPALDLIAGWHLLDHAASDAFRDAVGCDEREWQRSAAWALEQGMGLIWYYRESNPTMSSLGRSTVNRVLESVPVG